MSNVTPENLVEASIAAGYMEIMRQRLADRDKDIQSLTKERDDLQEKYDKVRNAGKTARHRSTLDPKSPSIKKHANAEEAMTEMLSKV
jgi:hypothetical protein